MPLLGVVRVGVATAVVGVATARMGMVSAEVGVASSEVISILFLTDIICSSLSTLSRTAGKIWFVTTNRKQCKYGNDLCNRTKHIFPIMHHYNSSASITSQTLPDLLIALQKFYHEMMSYYQTKMSIGQKMYYTHNV